MMPIAYTLNQIPEIVKNHIAPLTGTYTIITFTGPLGAGKTTLIKELLRQRGITQTITSPTFTYVNTYPTNTKSRYHHFDLYRIESIDDFIATGFDEYLNEPNSVNIIEWPSVIEALLKSPSLKNKVCHIVIDYDERNLLHRFLTISR